MNYFDKQDRCAFKPITENPIILDFSHCRYLGEIHLLLKEKFGLPDYYGENREHYGIVYGIYGAKQRLFLLKSTVFRNWIKSFKNTVLLCLKCLMMFTTNHLGLYLSASRDTTPTLLL